MFKNINVSVVCEVNACRRIVTCQGMTPSEMLGNGCDQEDVLIDDGKLLNTHWVKTSIVSIVSVH